MSKELNINLKQFYEIFIKDFVNPTPNEILSFDNFLIKKMKEFHEVFDVQCRSYLNEDTSKLETFVSYKSGKNKNKIVLNLIQKET